MATSAWAEVKTLECEYSYEGEDKEIETFSSTYAFDPELPDGEVGVDEIFPLKVTAFPNYYRLDYEVEFINGYIINVYIVDISRVDLSVTRIRKHYVDDKFDNESKVTGQCKFIESAKKLF